MTTKYAILNPNTGTYSYADTEKAALNEVSNIAMAFYLSHTHNFPISTITTDENGNETWATYNKPI